MSFVVGLAKIVNIVAYGEGSYDDVLKFGFNGVALPEFGRVYGGRTAEVITEVDKTIGNFHMIRWRVFLVAIKQNEPGDDIVVIVNRGVATLMDPADMPPFFS